MRKALRGSRSLVLDIEYKYKPKHSKLLRTRKILYNREFVKADSKQMTIETF